MMKLAIGLPFSGRFVPPEWAVALANLQFPMNCTYARISIKGQARGAARTALVKAATGMGAEYLLMLDDDTAPPYDTVIKLLPVMDADPAIAACGGIYTSRGTPVNEPMVFMGQGLGPFWRWRAGEVFPCWALGTGCLMVRLSAFAQIPEPWFVDVGQPSEATDDLYHTPKGPTIGFQMTDDIFFCKKVADAGLTVMAHGGVLPVHYSPEGVPHVLAYDSFPLRQMKPSDFWYAPLAPPPTVTEERDDDLPPGWLTPDEAAFLSAQVTGKRVLELGAYKGRSTVCMARTAAQVVSVDRHTGDAHTQIADSLPTYLRSTEGYPNVIPVLADHAQLAGLFRAGAFDVVYVDGAHDRASVARDLRLAQDLGADILAHDWDGFEVSAGAESVGLTAAEVVGSLARLVPVAA